MSSLAPLSPGRGAGVTPAKLPGMRLPYVGAGARGGTTSIMKPPLDDLRRLLAVVFLGAAVFAIGLVLGFRRLPEWRAVPVSSPDSFVERFQEHERPALLPPS